jgi:membrane protein implicated in regulation of membrane protease activity
MILLVRIGVVVLLLRAGVLVVVVVAPLAMALVVAGTTGTAGALVVLLLLLLLLLLRVLPKGSVSTDDDTENGTDNGEDDIGGDRGLVGRGRAEVDGDTTVRGSLSSSSTSLAFGPSASLTSSARLLLDDMMSVG